VLIAPPDPSALRKFIGEVAPEVRERVAVARAKTAALTATARTG
jgi:hypothetical protein